jgi:NADH-quinone oxidoreductase subunit K
MERTNDAGSKMVTLSHYLVLGALLFVISVIGIFLNRKNVIILLMCIELMLLAVNLNFIAFSHYLNDIAGQVFVFFILTVAAAESAIGLAILVVLFRNLRTINVDDLNALNG